MFGFLPIGLFYHAAYTRRDRRLLLWLLVRSHWPAHLDPDADGQRMIPAVVVFAYLAVVLVHRHLRVPRVGATRDAEDYFLAGRSLGPGRVPAVALRHEHDGVLDPRRVRPRLRQRHRHLRPDGVLVGADHPARPVRDRHAAVGARQAARLHDAGADVPRPLGVRPHRHGDLRGPGRAARALHHHRRDGRRHDAARRQRRRWCRTGSAARSSRWW